METKICQSCTMPLKQDSDCGTNSDGSLNADYCVYCMKNGEFASNETMEKMIETCIPFELEAGVYPDADTARTAMLEIFPKLKRWSVVVKQ